MSFSGLVTVTAVDSLALNVIPEDAVVSSEGEEGVRPVSHDILYSQAFDLWLTLGPGARFHM